jgi:ATP-dependent RNA helicase HelY
MSVQMRFKLPEIPPPQLISSLRGYNLLPAIVFLPTRKRCDEAATEVALFARNFKFTDERFEARRQFVRDFVETHPEIAAHKHRNLVIRGGVASHHAGHIPAWKLLVEKMMAAGLLDAIFATSTVAAGVDFPARTVVISNADTRGNDGWRPLTASELQQMTGRAGRRGRDQVGFALLAPGVYQNPQKIAELLKAPPDALQSQFRATYTSLLNLLDAYGSFAQVREIAERSFAFRETARKIARLERERRRAENFIEQNLKESGFAVSVADVRALERLASARMRLHESLPETRAELRHRWLAQNVQQGRIVTQGRGGRRFFLVLQKHGDKVVAMRDDGQGATVALDRINRVYARKYPLHEKSLDEAFHDIHEGRNPVLDEPRLAKVEEEGTEAADLIEDLIQSLPPKGLSKPERNGCLQILWEYVDDADKIEKARRDVEILRGEIWQPFENRARVLEHFGYLDYADQKVTDEGRWLADVRVDRPLLVGEALRGDFFINYETPHIAALMGALAADSDRNYGELEIEDNVLRVLGEFETVAFEVAAQEWRYGVEPAPEMNFSAAATAAFWASGADWDELIEESGASEGDLFRLLSRTGEALIQITGLKKSQPAAAEAAARAINAILRPPVR